MNIKALLLSAVPILAVDSVCVAEIRVAVDYNVSDNASAGFKFKNLPAPARNDAAEKASFTLVDGQRDRNGGELAALHDGRLPSEGEVP